MTDDIIPLRYSYVQTMVERISELEAEVERMRAAGDALAKAVDDTWWPDYPCDFPDLLAAWQEARRG